MVRSSVVSVALILIALAAIPQPVDEAEGSHAGGADLFALDADPAGNTATSIGVVDDCARIVVNEVQDADEDDIDAVNVDAVVSNIPASTAMIAFGFTVSYDESALAIEAVDSNYLLASAAGSSIFETAEMPDADGDDAYAAGVLDTGADSAESGSGVLQRITISADAGVTAGLYDLDIGDGGHVDSGLGQYVPDAFVGASVAVDAYCPATDSDGDGVFDEDEAMCGGDPYNDQIRPERIDGVFANVDDDGDTQVD